MHVEERAAQDGVYICRAGEHEWQVRRLCSDRTIVLNRQAFRQDAEAFVRELYPEPEVAIAV